MATEETILRTYFTDQVRKKGRFSKWDVMVPAPDEEEMYMAVFDALDDVNSAAPQTHFYLSDIYENSDPRWKRMVVLGAVAYSLDFMVFELTANGVDVQVSDVAIPNKLADITTLRGQMFDQFTTLLEKLKVSSQKFSRIILYNTTPKFQPSSYRRYVNYQYSRMGSI